MHFFQHVYSFDKIKVNILKIKVYSIFVLARYDTFHLLARPFLRMILDFRENFPEAIWPLNTPPATASKYSIN